MDLTTEQIESLWTRSDALRKKQARARRYYKGESDITSRNVKYSSGVKKSNVPTNWAGYVVGMYTGAMTAQPYQVAPDDEDVPDTTGNYTDISKAASLDATDVENLRNALICGYGLELHEFVDSEHKVMSEKPEVWSLLRDENEAIVVAMTRFVIPKGDLFRGEMLEAETEIQYVYDDKQRVAYRRTVTGAIRGAWTELERSPHYYGAVPVVEFRINDNRDPLLSDALLKQIDEYEEIDSLSGDDIRNTADAILVLKGVDPAWVKEHSELINSQRVLPIPDDAEATYLTRETDTQRIDSRMNRSREAIHIMACVPDIQQIVGATGGTSGIALKLKFMPMEQQAGAMALEIKKGIAQRIDVINSIMRKATQKTIDNYKIIIGFNMPINRIEEWDSIGNLTGIVSHKTQIELLSDIDDAQKELDQLEGEQVAQADIQAVNAPPEQQAATQDAQVAKAAPTVDATIENSINIIGDRILAAVLRTNGN